MKRKNFLFLIAFCAIWCCSFFNINLTSAYADSGKTVLLGGIPAGFNIETRGAYIAGLSDVITEDGIKSPSKDAGLNAGDVIYFINDIEINNAKDIENALKYSKSAVEIEYQRCANSYSVLVEPAIDLTGDKKLGLFVRDDVSGIGTVTFIDGNKIATLGHPVLNDDNSLLEIKSGNIYACDITGYVKGERGAAGELRGVILKNQKIATIDRNTLYGIYGTIVPEFNTKDLQ